MFNELDTTVNLSDVSKSAIDTFDVDNFNNCSVYNLMATIYAGELANREIGLNDFGYAATEIYTKINEDALMQYYGQASKLFIEAAKFACK